MTGKSKEHGYTMGTHLPAAGGDDTDITDKH